MRALLVAMLLGFCSATAAQSPATSFQPDSPPVDAAMAFARIYGVVRYFHPSDSLDRVDWNRFLVDGAARMAAIGDRAAIAPALEPLFTAPVADFKIVDKGAPAAEIEGEGPLVEWRHLGYGMEPTPRIQPYVSWRTHHKPLFDGEVKGSYFQHQGLAELVKAEPPIVRVPVDARHEALVPVSMPMSATKVGAEQEAKLKELAASLQSVSMAGDTFTRGQAWADGIAAWNVARHFYPYWSVVTIDWDAWLREWLAAQPERQSRAEMIGELRRLIAPLGDGHGGIANLADKTRKQFLPVSLRPLGSRWVVDASLVPERVKAGDEIVAVNGKPASGYFDERMALESGSPQFMRWRAARELCVGAPGTQVQLTLERGGRRVEASLSYDRDKFVAMARPEAIAQVRPGIYYVDLSRFDPAAFDAARDKLAAAHAIVFDLRGYPAPDAEDIVPYWITGADSAQWLIVPRFDGPFAKTTTGWSHGWKRERDPALAKPAKYLLTDGRAISYSESLVGYFAGQNTGRILGEATAGANGNVVPATLPSGLKYVFTGMRVTRHDGSIFHREGFKPDEQVVPTIAGLAAGRDEVLERAVAEASGF